MLKVLGVSFFKWVIILFIGIIPLLFFKEFLDAAHSPLYFIISLGYCLFFSICFFKNRLSIYSVDVFDIALILYLIMAFYSLHYIKYDSEALLEFNRILFFVISFVFFKTLLTLNVKNKFWISYGFLVAGLLYMFFGWMDYVFLYNSADIHKGLYSISAHIGHKNLLSIYLSLCLPLLYLMFFTYTSLKIRSLISVVFLAMVLLILFSMSRVGYVGIFMFIMILAYIKRMFLFKNKKRVFVIILSAIILVTMVGLMTHRGSGIYKRTLSIFVQTDSRDENNQSIKERKVLWAKTWELIKEHPFQGYGLGQWKFTIGSNNINETRAKFGNIIFQQPHNDFLWVWSENGFIALLLYSFLFIYPIFYLFKFQSKTKEETIIKETLCIAFMVFLIQSQFDFPKERPALLQFFAFYLALFSTQYLPKSFYVLKSSRILVFSALLGSIFLLLFFYNRLQVEYSISQLLMARKNKELHKIINLGTRIKSKSVFYDQTSTPIDFYIGEANFYLGNFFDAKQDFNTSIALNPTHLYSWNNLGGVMSQLENKDSAAICWKKAIELSKDFAEPRVNLSLLYLSQNQYEKSIEILRFDIEKESILLYENQLEQILTRQILKLKSTSTFADSLSQKELILILKNKKRMFWLYKTYTKDTLSFEIELKKDIKYSLAHSL